MIDRFLEHGVGDACGRNEKARTNGGPYHHGWLSDYAAAWRGGETMDSTMLAHASIAARISSAYVCRL